MPESFPLGTRGGCGLNFALGISIYIFGEICILTPHLNTMKKYRSLFLVPALLFTFACESLTDGLTDEEVVAGLKQALEVGTDTSVVTAHAADGYFSNPLIKIPFPPEATNVMNTVSNITLLGQPIGQTAVDGFVLKLNRAAEDAADEAGPIFINAITGMTIADGLDILMGADDAATNYLNSATYSSLKTTFQPNVETSLNTVGAQDAWTQVTTLYNTVSSNPVNTDLADYTTRKALVGLFTLIAGEELKIRTDPAARVTDLLSKVFAEQD